MVLFAGYHSGGLGWIRLLEIYWLLQWTLRYHFQPCHQYLILCWIRWTSEFRHQK